MADIPRSLKFYQDLLGFQISNGMEPMQSLFLPEVIIIILG
ncbi:MAG: VOC family protein [Puia sp.]